MSNKPEIKARMVACGQPHKGIKPRAIVFCLVILYAVSSIFLQLHIVTDHHQRQIEVSHGEGHASTVAELPTAALLPAVNKAPMKKRVHQHAKRSQTKNITTDKVVLQNRPESLAQFHLQSPLLPKWMKGTLLSDDSVRVHFDTRNIQRSQHTKLCCLPLVCIRVLFLAQKRKENS